MTQQAAFGLLEQRTLGVFFAFYSAFLCFFVLVELLFEVNVSSFSPTRRRLRRLRSLACIHSKFNPGPEDGFF